jgi:hypothetical protein
MLEGSCLCGGVRYEYDGDISELSLCHCSQCRRAQGSAFVAVGPIEAARFRLLAGAELLTEYRAVPHKARVFCSRCGSPLFSRRDDLPEVLRLRLGTVTTPFQCSNAYHQHTASKAAWFEITDALPQYPEGKAR